MRIVICAIATVVMLILASCEHKELCYTDPDAVYIHVTFDWRYAPDARPESVSLYLYPAGGGEVLRYEFTDRAGGIIRVPAGDYDAVCLNSDTKNLCYRNIERITTFEVTTETATPLSGLSSLELRSESAPRAFGTKNERVAMPAEKLWNDHKEDICLGNASGSQEVTFYPKPSHCTYTVEIRNVNNVKYLSGLSGSLSGLSGGVLVGVDEISPEYVTIPFGMEKSWGKNITGCFLTFGHYSLAQNTHQLTIYAVLTNGSKWYYSYDVTDQVHSAPDQHNVHIILDELPLPESIPGGGGFQASVDEWVPVYIDIPM